MANHIFLAICLAFYLAMAGCTYMSESAPFVEFNYSVKLTVDGEPYSLSQTYKCHHDFINPMRGKEWRVRNGRGSEILFKLANGDQALFQMAGYPCDPNRSNEAVSTKTYIRAVTDPSLIKTSSSTAITLGDRNFFIQDSRIETLSRGEDKALDDDGRMIANDAKRERKIYFVAYVQIVPVESITSQQFLNHIEQGQMRSITKGTSFPFTGWSDENVNYSRSFSYEFEKRDPKWDHKLASDPRVLKFFGEPDGSDWIVRRVSPSVPSNFRKLSPPNIDKNGNLVKPYHVPFWISYQGARVEIFPPYESQDFFDPQRNEVVRFSLREVALPF